MIDLHKKESPAVGLDFFIENYCNNLLEKTYGLKKVIVKVSDSFQLEYLKKKLEIVR